MAGSRVPQRQRLRPYYGHLDTYLGSGFHPINTRFADLNSDGRDEIVAFIGGLARIVYAYHNVNGIGIYHGAQSTHLGTGFRP